MMLIKPGQKFHGSKLIEVIKTTVVEGKGVDGDPVREVIYYSNPDGEELAKHDPYNKGE
jgi:hypothetical protein